MSTEIYTKTPRKACGMPRRWAMGIWIELGIFVLVLAFGLWQIHDVKRERSKRATSKKPGQQPPDAL